MSKISIYEVVPVPKLADKLVGTSVGGDPEDITYNFTLSELLNLFIPNIPGNTLQGVLDFGNTATQNINLTGIITTTTLNVGSTANILNSNLTGQTHITGGLYDRLNSIGTAGQVLTSTGTQVEWYTIPTVIPDLQQVLAAGNTAVNNIILTGNLSANNAALLTSTISTSLTVLGTLRDGLSSVGANNQVLSSNVTGVRWVNLPVYSATSPLLYNSGTGVFSIQQANASQNGYLSSADWITFDGKQTSISLTTTGNSGASTLVGATINVPNYTLAGLGGVPQTRTLTINGVTYNLSADRSWTLATGVSSVSATTPLFSTGGVNPDISIQQSSSSLDGYLSNVDWLTFNSKQPAGNYITSLTGEATAAGPGAASVTLSNAAVIGKLLTGLSITGSAISSSDSILTAFGKVQNQINGLIGGVQFQGVWNAATNTPALVSSVGTQGYYYIVDVAGNTNLNGITDWQVGDWAIFNGSTWNKVDNTDLVTSVNGQIGAVSLTTDNIPEGATNLYYLDSRARAALSFAAGSGAYNSTTGVIAIPTDNSQILNGAGYITLVSLSATSPLTYNNTTGAFAIQVANTTQDGYLSSTDWNTFNGKQPFLGGTGLVKSVAGVISYITDNSANWNTAYNDSIVSAAVTGTATKTLTLNQQDGGTITASWSDIDTGLTSVGVSMPSAFTVTNSPLTSNGTIAITGSGNTLQYVDGTGALQSFPSLTGYVPYTGATANVNLGIYNLTAASLIKNGGTSGQFLKADGSVDSSAYIVLGSLSATAPLSYNNTTGVFTISQSGASTNGYLSSTDWNTFNNKQATITLTTTGSSGASTLIGNTLNIPNYANLVTSVFGRIGAVVATEGDYSLTQLSDVTITTPSSGQVLKYNGTAWVNDIDTDTGITSLNGLTALTQTFAVGTSGTDFAISSVTSTHTFNLPTASVSNRGALSSADWTTFNSKEPAITAGTTLQYYRGDKTFQTLDTTVVPEGTNLYYLDSRARAAISLTTTGSSGAATYNNTTGVFNIPDYGAALTGYVPTSRTLNINGTSYDLSADRSWSVGTVTSVAALTLGTTGTDLSSSVATGTTTPVITLNVPTASAANRGALSAADWSTFNTKVGGVTATSPLFSSGGSTPNITIQQSSGSQDGYLSSTDWTTFNNKQVAGSYITSLTGEATATGPGAAAVTLDNASVTAKILTGVNITGGTVLSTDTMLTAFGKLQNQINGLIGGSIYQGTWNAATNTPTLTSSVGTQGYYYIVSVAGTTNLDGITDWFVGDWAIFNGGVWQQVDNTDAVVSVNGQTGAVSLTTDNISEGVTNLYYTDTRARAALSFVAGSGAYNSSTGAITIPTNTSQLTNGANFITLASLSGTAPISYNSGTGAISITQSGTASNGYLSSTDWNTFNNKQSALTNPVLASGTWTSNYIPKINGTYTLTNSLLYDGGSSIGINTNAPFDSTQFKLDVNGGFIVKNTSGVAAQFVLIDANPASGGNAGFFIQSVGGTLTSAFGQIQTYYGTSIAAGALRLQPSGGQVLVGTATGSAFMVDINGTLRTTGQLTLGSTITNGTYTYTLPGATGTIALVGGAGVGTVTSVAALTIGTTGTDLSSTVANSTTTPVITLNVPTASAANRGALSAADWTTFNNKQSALTNPVTGTGTNNVIPKFTSTGSTIGDSSINNTGTNNEIVAVNKNGNHGTRIEINNSTDGGAAQSYIGLNGATGAKFFNMGKVAASFTPLSWLGGGDGYLYNGTANLSIYNESGNIQFRSNGVTSNYFMVTSSVPVSVGNGTTIGGRYEFYKDGTPTKAGVIGNSISGGTATDNVIIGTYNTTTSWVSRVTIFNSTSLTQGARVSIGGTSDGIGLTIEGSNVADAAFQLNNTSATGHGWSFYSTGTGYSQPAGNLLFYRQGLDSSGGFGTFTWDGRFGLGTLSPAYTLDVNGTGRFSSALTVEGSTAQLFLNGSGGYGWIQYQNNGSGDWIHGTNVGGAGNDWNLYNYGTTSSAFKIAKSNNAATFSSSVQADGSSNGFLINQNGGAAGLATYSANTDRAQFAFKYAQNFPGSNNYTRVLDIVSTGDSTGGGMIRLFTTVNNSTPSAALILATNGTATFSNLAGTGTRMVVADANGTLSTQAVPSGTVTGSGVANYVAKWSSASALSYGLLYDNGSFVGVNTDTASAGLLGANLTLRASATNTGQTAIAIQGYDKVGRWAINGQDAASSYNLSFYPSNGAGSYSLAMVIGSSGNLGISDKPSAWFSTWRAVEIFGADSNVAGNGSGPFRVIRNAYIDTGGTWIYKNTDFASFYQQSSANHIWYSAPSGTAGAAITFTPYMTLNASGNLGLGVTPSAWSTGNSVRAIQLNGGSFWSYSDFSAYVGSNYYWDGSVRKYIISYYASEYQQVEGSHIWFSAPSGTAGTTATFTERMRITSGGNVQIGSATSVSATSKLQVINSASQNLQYTSSGSIECYAPEGNASYVRFGSAYNLNGVYSGTSFNYIIEPSYSHIFRSQTTALLTITSTGNVGIGITNPGAKLQVKTSTSAGATDAFYIENTSLALFGVRDDGLIYMRGNVGIGTLTPITKMEVRYNGNNGGGDYAGYNILATTDSTSSSYQATIGAMHQGAGYANLNLGSKDIGSGVNVFWHISKRLVGDGHRLEYYYYNGSGFSSKFYFTTAGDFWAAGDITAYSDARVKTNIRPIENVLERVTKSRGVLYDRTDTNTKNNIGFIAQELELQFPELITTNTDGTKGVKYQNAVAILFEAVKEQQKQIDQLKKQVA